MQTRDTEAGLCCPLWLCSGRVSGKSKAPEAGDTGGDAVLGLQEPGPLRLSAGARLHHSCLGMVWKILECSSLSSGTGLHPCLTQTSEVSGFQARRRMWEPRACTRLAVLPALHESLTLSLPPCQLDWRCP